jgi:hypothetical protein
VLSGESNDGESAVMLAIETIAGLSKLSGEIDAALTLAGCAATGVSKLSSEIKFTPPAGGVDWALSSLSSQGESSLMLSGAGVVPTAGGVSQLSLLMLATRGEPAGVWAALSGESKLSGVTEFALTLTGPGWAVPPAGVSKLSDAGESALTESETLATPPAASSSGDSNDESPASVKIGPGMTVAPAARSIDCVTGTRSRSSIS